MPPAQPVAADAAANAAQVEYWNVSAGPTWAQFQQRLDRQLAPVGREALRVLAPVAGEHILDIGCGAGDSSLDLAERVAPDGRVVGIDISRPLLDLARRRVDATGQRRIEFRELDAQTGALGTGAFDAAFSRFGVMFFSDPVAAFANIRGALRPAGRLAFVCWRALEHNPWMQAPLAAGLAFLPPLPPIDPLAPGPFAFADPDRVRAILTAAGFGSVTIDPFDTLVGGGDLDDTLELSLKVGPLGAALRELPDRRAAVIGAVRAVLARHVTAAGVLMPAAVFIVRAVRGPDAA